MRLLDVEGSLSTDDGHRLRSLLVGLIDETDATAADAATSAVVVDLRRCTFVAAVCMRELANASEELVRRGGSGIALVTDEGSPLARRVGRNGWARLRAYGSPALALRALAGERVSAEPSESLAREAG